MGAEFPLKFEIPSLDRLFRDKPNPEEGTPQTDAEPTGTTTATDDSVTSLAISGPDGSGKSIIALHLLSAYWLNHCAGHEGDGIRCVYVSTDLSHDQAQRIWKGFGLDHPRRRLRLLADGYGHLSPHVGAIGKAVQLVPIRPSGKQELADVADSHKRSAGAYFVDIQGESAGDGWQFIGRLLGNLPATKTPHLVIIDAVEGLEIMVGRRDAFGEPRTRRSRISQLVRLAKANNRAHLAFVIEDARPHRRLPEQFVTDMVLRLRQRRRVDYLTRTIEIEKCRGFAHVRGEQQMVIRSGAGNFTGIEAHIDEPEIPLDRNDSLAHIHVFRSLHGLNSDIRRMKRDIPVYEDRPPRFGISELDKLLGTNVLAPASSSGGSIALLLGDPGTYKSKLGIRFLAAGLEGSPDAVGVLLTTGMIDRAQLARQLRMSNLVGNAQHSNSLLCRRLGVRYDSSAAFIDILRRYIHHARQKMLEHLRKNSPGEWRDLKTALAKFILPGEKLHADHLQRFQDEDLHARGQQRTQDDNCRRLFNELSSRIFLVIDDLNVYLNAHPNILNDPLFLQSLLFVLKVEQVSALLIATQSGKPNIMEPESATAGLRALDERQILTWSIPFFGEKRTAITTLHQGRLQRANDNDIYELTERAGKGNARELEIDTHFALYSGLEEGNPHRIPLKIRLFSGYHAELLKQNAHLYSRVVKDTIEQVFPSDDGEPAVRFEPVDAYDEYATFTRWLDNTRLESTLVFQIDEFWSQGDGKRKLLPLKDYFDEKLKENGNDVYQLYHRHPLPAAHAEKEKRNPAPRITSLPLYNGTAQKDVTRKLFFTRSDADDRVPYLWDFGFLLARRDLWHRASDQNVPRLLPESNLTVSQVWNALCIDSKKEKLKDGPLGSEPKGSDITWYDFFSACDVVGRVGDALPFHVDVTTSETVTSLLLEIWASVDRQVAQPGWLKKVADRKGSPNPIRLADLVKDHPKTLFLAMITLAGICRHFRSRDRILSASHNDKACAAAERHWYSTASVRLKEFEHPMSVLRLPGNCSVRGDWSLAVAAGSRSQLLAHRALDILSARRMSLLRLHSGVGLPCRDVISDDQVGKALTSLYRMEPASQTVVPIQYGDLCSLAPAPPSGASSGFFELRRSWLMHYQHETFYFRRFVARAFEELETWYSRDLSTEKTYADIVSWIAQSDAIADPITKKIEERFDNFQLLTQLLLGALPPLQLP